MDSGLELPGILTPIKEPTPFDRGMEASERSANAKWTEQQREEVRAAIRAVAAKQLFFTTDAVWEELGDEFPVTKGIASIMNAIKRENIITATNTTEISRRKNAHGHAQRLVVWQSVRKMEKFK